MNRVPFKSSIFSNIFLRMEKMVNIFLIFFFFLKIVNYCVAKAYILVKSKLLLCLIGFVDGADHCSLCSGLQVLSSCHAFAL